MAYSSPTNANRPGWFARNDFRLARFIFAALLLGVVSCPLACRVADTVDKSIKGAVPPSDANAATSSASPGNSPANVTVDSGTTPAGDQSGAGSPPSAAGGAVSPASVTLQIWTYGLSLAALSGALAVSLWAVVALCREE
jgi:hypothetical protein